MSAPVNGGTAYMFDDTNMTISKNVSCPETQIDGDLFWVFVRNGKASLSFEQFDGQAAEALKKVFASNPSAMHAVVTDSSPFGDPGDTLADMADADEIEFPDVSRLGKLYHGTSSARLESILSTGLRSDHDLDRCWNTPEMPRNQVFLAVSPGAVREYAERASARFGGDPVVLEIDASRLDHSLYAPDYDFRHANESAALAGGFYGDVSPVQGSLAFIGKVAYAGTIIPDAVSVHDADIDEAARFRP